jgi:hypothetical protein
MICIQQQDDNAHLLPNEIKLKSLCRHWRNSYLIEYCSVILNPLFSEQNLIIEGDTGKDACQLIFF